VASGGHYSQIRSDDVNDWNGLFACGGHPYVKAGGGNAALQTAGTQTVTVSATGYTDATVSQPIGAGAPNKLAITTQQQRPLAMALLWPRSRSWQFAINTETLRRVLPA